MAEQVELEAEKSALADSSVRQSNSPPVFLCVWPRIYWTLFASNFLSAWGDRMWSFAVPLILSKLFNGLMIPSIFITVAQLFCVLLGGYAGHLIDMTNRRKLMQTSLIIQNASVVSSFVLLITIQAKLYNGTRIDAPWSNPMFVLLFIGAVAFGSVAAVASMITSIAMSKDWIVVIQKANPYLELNRVNANFRRMDLVCKLLAPLAFALILKFAGLTLSLIIVTSWNAFSLIPESILIQELYRTTPEMAIGKEMIGPIRPNPAAQIISGWTTYIRQGILLSSLAYSFLYLTVLSPGGIMTAYLELNHLSEIVIAVFTGLGALTGLLATTVAPYLIPWLKLRRTGVVALYAQFLVLLLCFLPFIFKVHVVALPLAIALSRFGLWLFDLVEVQTIQTYVSDEDRGKASGVEYSLCSLISVFSFGLGIIVPDPKDFIYLVSISVGAVALAVLTYTYWYINPPDSVLLNEMILAGALESDIKQEGNTTQQTSVIHTTSSNDASTEPSTLHKKETNSKDEEMVALDI